MKNYIFNFIRFVKGYIIFFVIITPLIVTGPFWSKEIKKSLNIDNEDIDITKTVENTTNTKTDYPLWKITAYCPCEKCCGKFSDGITASGYKLKKGNKLCAAPKEFSFTTILYIPGYGLAPVLDRGGAIDNYEIDVYFDTHKEALNFGVKFVHIQKVK